MKRTVQAFSEFHLHLNFLVNVILPCFCRSQVFEFCHISKDLLHVLYYDFVLQGTKTWNFTFCMFTSTPTILLTSISFCVLIYCIYVLREINYHTKWVSFPLLMTLVSKSTQKQKCKRILRGEKYMQLVKTGIHTIVKSSTHHNLHNKNTNILTRHPTAYVSHSLQVKGQGNQERWACSGQVSTTCRSIIYEISITLLKDGEILLPTVTTAVQPSKEKMNSDAQYSVREKRSRNYSFMIPESWSRNMDVWSVSLG